MTDSTNRLTQLQVAMQAAQVDLVAVGPTANMHYLLGYVPHPDERLCLLLVSTGSARIVVPALNAEGPDTADGQFRVETVWDND